MSWAPGDLKSFYQYSFNTSAVCSSRRLIGFCGISAELWCWEPKQVENLNFLPVRFSHVLLFYEWSSGLQMCFCVRDGQRCSGPFSYITVEMGFFKAFPAFLSDGWMYPGSREQCCMCCFSCFLVNPATRYLHICVLSYLTCLCLFQLFLWASSVFFFIQSNISNLYQPTLQVIPPPARQLVKLVESFRNVTTCSVFVIRSLKALDTLVLVIWYVSLPAEATQSRQLFPMVTYSFSWLFHVILG